MAVKSEFDIPVGCIEFRTHANGDMVIIRSAGGVQLELDEEAAANLAALINLNGSGAPLRAVIKQAGD